MAQWPPFWVIPQEMIEECSGAPLKVKTSSQDPRQLLHRWSFWLRYLSTRTPGSATTLIFLGHHLSSVIAQFTYVRGNHIFSSDPAGEASMFLDEPHQPENQPLD